MPGEAPPPSTLWGGRRRGQFASTLDGRAVDVLRVVREIAARLGVTVAQVALKWVIAHPEISCAISGADTDAQVEENLGALDFPLPPEDLRRLDETATGLEMILDGPRFP